MNEKRLSLNRYRDSIDNTIHNKILLELKIKDTFFNLMKGNFQQKQEVVSYLMVKREIDKTALVMKEDLKKTRKLFCFDSCL